MKYFIILLYISREVFEAIIQFLNTQYMKKDLPENVRDVYSQEEYQTWRAYEKESGRTNVLETIVSIIINLIFLTTDVYAHVFQAMSGLIVYMQYLAVIVLFSAISTLISIPFDYYDTFVTETHYGLNRSTRKTFWLDVIKSFLIDIVISYVLIILIMVLFEKFGNLAILWCSLIMMVLLPVIMLIVVPLMRIFNRFVPLEDGELKDHLLALCNKYGVHVRKIVVRDASRRTTTANAFCTGLGKWKTISLDDNLVNHYSVDEITAVFAHEFAHARYHHSLKSLPLSIGSLILVFIALAIVLNIPGLYSAFGFSGINYYFANILTGIILWPVSTVLQIISNYFSRKHEYQADAFAAEEGYGRDLIAALKRLHKESLSDINPHPAEVILYYSHPTLSQRITAIEKIMQKKAS